MSTEHVKPLSLTQRFSRWLAAVLEGWRRKIMAKQIEEQEVQALFVKLTIAATLSRNIPIRRRQPGACMEDG